MATTDDQNDPRLSKIDAKGMQETYLVLSEEERTKGFVRPVRKTYIHEVCHTSTSMGLNIAETYARDPKFYGGTYCAKCQAHFPVGEHGQFIWLDGSKVGS